MENLDLLAELYEVVKTQQETIIHLTQSVAHLTTAVESITEGV